MPPKRQRYVCQRRERQHRHLARVLGAHLRYKIRRLSPRSVFHRALLGPRLVRAAHAPEPVFAVHEIRDEHRGIVRRGRARAQSVVLVERRQRRARAVDHRQPRAGFAPPRPGERAHLDERARVSRRVVAPNVAEDGGEAEDFDLGRHRFERERDGEGVVDAGIGVDDELARRRRRRRRRGRRRPRRGGVDGRVSVCRRGRRHPRRGGVDARVDECRRAYGEDS